MALSVRQLDSLDAPGLEENWQRLCDRTPHVGIFSTHQWCRHWLASFGGGSRLYVQAVEDEGGEVRAILPTYIERRGPVRWLKLLGRERVSGDHLDLLCAPADHRRCLEALWAHWERSTDFDGLQLGELHGDSPTLTALRFWARQRGYATRECQPQTVPYVDLPASFDAYLNTLSANMRYHVRRRLRDVARRAAGVLRVVDRSDAVDALLANLFDLHRRRWQRDGQPGNFGTVAKRDFLRQFCRQAAERGWVRLIVLEAGGRPEGVLLAFHWRETASFYQMGWNPATMIASPGVVLLAASIRQAISEGLKRYDFLRGDEPYKRRWTTQAIEQITLLVALRTPARAALAALDLKERVKSTLGPAAWGGLKRLLGVRRTVVGSTHEHGERA